MINVEASVDNVGLAVRTGDDDDDDDEDEEEEEIGMESLLTVKREVWS